jgi:hypothetical protein
MDMDRMDELARDPRFIPGIYNYCDAWCKRCAFTSRCMNYAMGKEMESAGSQSQDSENETFWDKLHETFESAMEGFEEEAEEMDFDIDEEDFDEFLDQEEEVREAAHSQPCCRTAMRYRDVVDEWFKLHEDLFADKGGELEFLTRADEPGDGSADDVTAIRDCLEVIRWYQLQIWVKLCRAATGTIRAEVDGLEGFQEDADGSAKVAILGVERSIAAWATVLTKFPDHEDAIFALGTLKRLLRQVDAAFPNARAFRRPGFDTDGT